MSIGAWSWTTLSWISFKFWWRQMIVKIIQNLDLIEKCIANRKPCHQRWQIKLKFQIFSSKILKNWAEEVRTVIRSFWFWFLMIGIVEWESVRVINGLRVHKIWALMECSFLQKTPLAMGMVQAECPKEVQCQPLIGQYWLYSPLIGQYFHYCPLIGQNVLRRRGVH